MKRIFLLSTMIISSFGMMNLQAQQAAMPGQATIQPAAAPITPVVGANAKKLVTQVNTAVALRGDQFSTVNNVCIEYYQKLDAITKAKPADANAQIAALKKTRDEKIKALLDPSQLRSWVDLKE